MRKLIAVFAAALLAGIASGAALADTNVRVKIKTPPQKVEVKGVTQTQIVAHPLDFSIGDKTVVVKPLTAAGNPYAKAYTDYDRWVYTNARPDLRFADLHWVDGRWVATDPASGATVDVAVAQVTPEGYLVPVTEKVTENVGPNVVPVLPRAATSKNYYVIATGTPDAPVRKVYVQERARVLAPVAPRIPDWLIKQPAKQVLFTPHDFVVQRADVWYRYDANGTLIAQTKPGESWRVLFWPKYTTVTTDALGKKLTVLDDEGYVVVRDAGGKIDTVYDYDGTPLKVEEVKVSREPYFYTPLDWDTIQQIHGAQTVTVDGTGTVKVETKP